MAETAAHLVDHVLPPVPVRQWVLTLPFALRYLVAFDADLLADVRRRFVRAVFRFQRAQARRHGINPAEPGAVVFVQRFGTLHTECRYAHAHGLVVNDDCPRRAPVVWGDRRRPEDPRFGLGLDRA